MATGPTSAAPRGPRYDESLDDTIVEAAAELLAEVGYDAMSIEAVAARAGVGKATIYRRWSGKEPLVLDTVRARGFPVTDVPDTGDLRGDLLALFLALRSRLDERVLHHLTGVLVAMRRHDELAQAVKEQFVASLARATREIVERAVARGEIAAQSDEFLELFAKTGPSVVSLRFFMADGPIDDAFMERLVDEILLPILRSS